MSHKSRHTKHPVKSARVMTNKGDDIDYLKTLTVADIFKQSMQLYGNTKFQDYAIVLAFILCKGNVRLTSVMVGYSTSTRGHRSLRLRLNKINSRNYLELTSMMIAANHLTDDDLAAFLSNTKKRGGMSLFHKAWGTQIVDEAIDVAGDEFGAAELLGIHITVLNNWLTYKD